MEATTNALNLRPRVTGVSVTDLLKETEDPTEVGFRYVYIRPGNGELAELRMPANAHPDEWCDETGWDWSPEMKDLLRKAVDQTEKYLPRIQDAPPWDDLRDRAIKAVQDANDPPVFFERGGYPTEITRNEKGIPVSRLVTTTRMRDRLGEVALWFKVGKAGPYDVKPPADIAGALLETPGLHLPALEAITEFPVLSKDRRIMTRRGFDPGSSTYFAPSRPLGKLELDVPLRVCFAWLDEMVTDFEFHSKADKTNLIAFMLIPILRSIIDGPVPLAAVRAVKAGTGKSLLIKAALSVLMGRVPEIHSLGDDENEAEKRLTSWLMNGTQVVFLDNIPTGSILKQAALARALQAPMWTARIIQTSKSPILPVRCSWVCTGNNLTMSDEIARRSYLIELAPSMERPDLRTDFLHPNLLEWVVFERSGLLSALLCIVKNWVDEGMPITDGPVLSTFEGWSRIVGSVLRSGGARHFLANEDHKRDIVEDPVNLEREILLLRIAELQEVKDGNGAPMLAHWWTVKDLRRATGLDADMCHAVQPFLKPKTTWMENGDEAVIELGYKMRTFVEGIYGGRRLIKGRRSEYGQTFRVENVTPQVGS